MIELHSHVLPGLDDGAVNMEEALQLLKQYAEQQVSTVVCTPHLLPQFCANPDTLTTFLDRRDAKLTSLQRAAERNCIEITLIPGAELVLTTNILPYLQEPLLAERITINKSGYVLVELPHALPGGLRTLEGLLFEIQLAGLLPILAHPERSAHNPGVLPVLKQWVESGRVLLQVNAGHLADDNRLPPDRQERYRARQPIAWDMLHQNLVCVVSSDAHNPTGRPAQTQLAYQAIRKQLGAGEAMRLMVENPKRIIQDEAVLG